MGHSGVVRRFVWSQLRQRPGRSAALLSGVLVATTGFVLLTGTSTALEQQDRLVRPNSLSGQYGGITLAQYEKIRAIPGIEVAAPIAVVGYSIAAIPAP